MQYKTYNRSILGYFFTAFAIIVWGTTFISTKVLLLEFNAIEILYIRFIIAYISLWIMAPRRLVLEPLPTRLLRIKRELYFAGAGIFGVTLYQLIENIALQYTQASNVSVIASTAPIFTAFAIFVLQKKLNVKQGISRAFIIGFIFSIIGIALISFSGTTELQLNPKGDILALSASIIWAGYSVCMLKVNELNTPVLESTRRIFFYALITMLPFMFTMGLNFDISENITRFSNIKNIGNFLFLGIFASSLTFAAWAMAGKYLGIIKTTVFIYAIPIVTLIFAAIILNEKVTLLSLLGIILTVLGLLISRRS